MCAALLEYLSCCVWQLDIALVHYVLESVPYVSPTLTSCDKYMCGWMDGHLPIRAKGV